MTPLIAFIIGAVVGMCLGFILAALLFNSHKEPTAEADWDIGANDGR